MIPKQRIIAISGIPGAGKTSLATALARHLHADLICFDDFEQLTHMSPEELHMWLAQGAELKPEMAPGLNAAIARAGPKIVLDHPFGRLWPGLEQSLSYMIWLDCPLDIALTRKLLRLAQEAQQNPAFATWISGWLQAYPLATRPALEMLCAHAQPAADLTLCAKKPTETLCSIAVQRILRRKIG